MESLVEDYPHLLEFDSEMNEFHVLHSNRNGKLQVYHCISCGGNPPQSLRHTFFEAASESDFNDAWAKVADLENENDFVLEFGAPTHVFEIPPMPEKDIEIYGMKPVKKQWTFEPDGSLISYCLQLMTDGTYQKSLGPKHKQGNNA